MTKAQKTRKQTVRKLLTASEAETVSGGYCKYDQLGGKYFQYC